MSVSPFRAAIVLYPGVDELGAFGPFEVLARAGEHCALEPVLVASDQADAVEGAHGATVGAAGSLTRDWDLVVVPGGGSERRRGAFAQAAASSLPARLAALHAHGATIASVCTGALLVSAAGLLRGRPAAGHPDAADVLRRDGADVIAARVVDDGDLVTCGAVAAGIDMALWLVARACGGEVADRVADDLGHAWARDVHRGPRFGAPQRPRPAVAERRQARFGRRRGRDSSRAPYA